MHQIPPLERARVAASHTVADIATAAKYGIDLDTFRAEIGFDERTINRDSFVSVDLHIRILDLLSRRLRDPIFGAKAGDHSIMNAQQSPAASAATTNAYRTIPDWRCCS